MILGEAVDPPRFGTVWHDDATDRDPARQELLPCRIRAPVEDLRADGAATERGRNPSASG